LLGNVRFANVFKACRAGCTSLTHYRCLTTSDRATN